ncbi:MAG: aminoacetone oxidase family FAD-binding enzyme [Lachnospiraceae bacterium]|nr:aminoacetone oxidase family FAD-binding enzyme [Lachnospiraceae bacterium]
MENKMKIAVIGAGASGMMAAISAAKYGAEVTLFEKNERVGKKILATGNGKCNLGNLAFSTDYYYCEDKEKLHKIFRVFSVWDSMMFFENIGLMVKSKSGYLYPYSEQASAVLDVLRMELLRTKVDVVTGVLITDAQYHDREALFELKDASGNAYQFKKLIIACGSCASLKKGEGMTGYELARQLGHQINPVVPGLVQLHSSDSFIKALSGVRCQARIKLLVDGEEAASENGELQFTQYGVSGIPIFQVSRIAAYAQREGKTVEVLADFFPDQDEKTFTYMSRLRYESQMDKNLEDYLTGMLHKKINMVMIKQAGLKPGMTAMEAGWKAVSELMGQYRRFIIHICGDHSTENAQVCAGGVALSQISTELESEVVKGLHFAGEIVDVDGKCGGYNLQWAWSSGYIAGRNAAGSSTKEIAENEEGQLKQEESQKEKLEC